MTSLTTQHGHRPNHGLVRMSDTQLPKALQLAELMQAAVQTYPQQSEDEPGGYCTQVDQLLDEAAAELIRLDAREDELLHHVCVLQGMNDESLESIRALTAELEQARAALAAQGEPVGEVFTMEALGTLGKPFCHVLLNRTLPTGTKLYTAAPAKPMTGAIQQDSYKQADGSKNCMQCSVAYLLGLPTSDVPDFEQAGPDAWDSFYSFISDRGFTAEMFPPTVEIYGDYLASGYTTRGTSHMVVMRGGELLHDPHPSNDGLKSVQVVWVIARKAPRCITDKGGA